MKYSILLLLLLFVGQLQAQQDTTITPEPPEEKVETPSEPPVEEQPKPEAEKPKESDKTKSKPPQQTIMDVNAMGTLPESFLITNVTAHLGDGRVLQNCIIGVVKDTISVITTNPKDVTRNRYVEIFNGFQRHVYPGVIAPNTHLGLVEVEAVRATRDFNEVGQYNPNVRSIIAYNTDSDIIPTVRSNGILFAEIAPTGSRLAGQSSVTYLVGDHWEDAALKMDVGVHLYWPQRYVESGWWAAPAPPKDNKNYERQVRSIRAYFDAAYAYSSKEDPAVTNLKFESMRGLFDGSKKLLVHVEDVKSMRETVELFKTYGIELVLVGAADAWRIPDYLKENNVAVILSDVHSLPQRPDEDIDQPFRTPAILHEAGVKFCFSMNGSWQQRNLMFQAGQAVSYGLPKEAAIQALTLNTAEILGIEKLAGSLAVGKSASFIMAEGDLLDMRSSVITHAYVRGRRIKLDNKHRQLYRKYMKKYEIADRSVTEMEKELEEIDEENASR